MVGRRRREVSYITYEMADSFLLLPEFEGVCAEMLKMIVVGEQDKNNKFGSQPGSA